MALTEDELARKTDGPTLFAARPCRATWTFEGLTSRDSHSLKGSVSFGISVPEDPIDRKMLVETLMYGRESVSTVDVIEDLSAVLREAARKYVTTVDAATLLSDGRDALLAEVKKVGAAAAFACGVELVRPYTLTIESPSLLAEQSRAAERARAEADAAERQRHIQRASDLAATLKNNGTSPTALLSNVAPNDRAATLAALIASGTDEAESAILYVVSGAEVYTADVAKTGPGGLNPIGNTFERDNSIGALRSVGSTRIGEREEIVTGGQTGIRRTSDGLSYFDPQAGSPFGFNAITYIPKLDQLWATHSERGLVQWKRNTTATPVSVFAANGAANLLTLSVESAVFSAKSSVFLARLDETVSVYEGPSDIVGIVVDRTRVHVIHDDGNWVTLERDTWRVGSKQATGGAVSAVAALPWVGGVRLLLARRDGPIDCLGTDDTLVTRYASTHVGLRAVCASQQWVAAVTGDRQRVLLWHAVDGRQPAHEIHVARLTGHRAAGIAIG